MSITYKSRLGYVLTKKVVRIEGEFFVVWRFTAGYATEKVHLSQLVY